MLLKGKLIILMKDINLDVLWISSNKDDQGGMGGGGLLGPVGLLTKPKKTVVQKLTPKRSCAKFPSLKISQKDYTDISRRGRTRPQDLEQKM